MVGLSPKEITELLKINASSPYPIPPQYGPLRHFENEMRCACRGCGCSTYLRLEGIPRCSIHAMKMMNEMLMTPAELEERERKNNE